MTQTIDESGSSPKNWKVTKFGEMAVFLNGYAFAPEDWKEDGLPIIRIEQLRDENASADFYDKPLPERFGIRNGDLIFSWSASLLTRIWDRGEAYLNQHLFKVENRPNVNRAYLKHLLDFNIDAMASETHGSTMKHITRPALLNYPVEVPIYFAEQRAIAEILTTVDDAIEQTEALIRKYQRIKQGLMQDLLKVKESWTILPLGIACKKGGGSVQTGPFGSQLHSSDYKDEGIPIITVEHLGDNEIIHKNLPLVGKEDYRRLSKYKIITGDLVFSRVGAIDRCAYVSENENGWLFSGRLLRVRPGSLFDSRFLSYLLNHYPSRLWILNNSVGSTMKCLNTTILSELPIPIPSMTEQKEIGEKISSIDRLIQDLVQEMEKLTRIKQGLMQDLLTGKVRVDALLKN